MSEERSEVNYKKWSWDTYNEGQYAQMLSFIEIKQKEGYTIIQNKIENTGFTREYNLHYKRGSIIYYKAKPNDESIKRMMSFHDSSIAYVTIEEEKIYNEDGNTWFIDDTNDFENGLQNLTSQLAKMLDAGYEVTHNTLQSTVNKHRKEDSDEDSDEDSNEDSDEDSDDEDDDTVVIKINIHLQRSAYAKDLIAKIRAEQRRRAEEEQRLRMEKEERNRQEQVVSKAQNIFSPNYKRGLELKYTNLQKAGTRSRRKRTQRKQRKTKNKKRS